MIDLTEAKLEMGEAGKGLIDEEYDEAVKQNNETASRMVAEGGAMDAGSDVDADGNMIQTVKYFDENGKEAPSLARHTAKYEEGRNAVDVAAEPSSRGKEVPVTTETPTMRGLRELQAEELETDRKRFTPTESTNTEDGLNRQVYGSKVRYTDDKGNVVKWGELDADGNETAADAPGSTKLQADMDARTKRFNDGESVWSSMSDASKSFARAAQWNAAANAQRAERAYQSQQAMNGVIADADRIRNEKLAKKREQRLAAGDAFAIATSRLKGDVQKDPETGKIDDPRLRTEVGKDGVEHNYIVSVVGRDELGSVNSRRRNAGSMNEYNSVIARYEVDANGNKIGDVEFGVSDRVGGKAGSNNQFRFISSSQAARMLQKDLVANGVDAEDAKHQVVNTILGGLSNPYGWSTNKAGVLQTKQMQKNFDEGKNLTHNIAPEKGTTVDKQRELDIQQQNGVMNAITNLIKTEQAILGNAAASEADKTAARNRIAEYNATLKGLNGVFANINGGGVSSAANRPRTADDFIAEKTKQQKTAANSASSAGNETAVNVGKDVKHESAKRASADAKAPSDIV